MPAMLAHARCCPPPALAFCAMSESAAIPAHGDQHGRHTMPCSRRAPPPHGPALHGAASLKRHSSLGRLSLGLLSLSAARGQRGLTQRVLSALHIRPTAARLRIPLLWTPCPPPGCVHASHALWTPCSCLCASHSACAATCPALRASVGLAAATHLRIPVAPVTHG